MMKYDKLKLILFVDDYFLKVIYYIEIYRNIPDFPCPLRAKHNLAYNVVHTCDKKAEVTWSDLRYWNW